MLLYNLGFYGISVSKLCHPFFAVVCCSLLFPIFPIFGAKIQSKLCNEEPSIASVFKGIIEYPSAPSTVFENHKKVSFNITSSLFKSEQKLVKNAKKLSIWWDLKTYKFRSSSVTKKVNFDRKMPIFINSNATFWVIFKQCALGKALEAGLHDLWGY